MSRWFDPLLIALVKGFTDTRESPLFTVSTFHCSSTCKALRPPSDKKPERGVNTARARACLIIRFSDRLPFFSSAHGLSRFPSPNSLQIHLGLFSAGLRFEKGEEVLSCDGDHEYVKRRQRPGRGSNEERVHPREETFLHQRRSKLQLARP